MMTQYTTYNPSRGQRWDLVANISYGDPLGYAGIVEANPDYSDRITFNGDETLRVPVLDDQQAIAQTSNLPPWRR